MSEICEALRKFLDDNGVKVEKHLTTATCLILSDGKYIFLEKDGLLFMKTNILENTQQYRTVSLDDPKLLDEVLAFVRRKT